MIGGVCSAKQLRAAPVDVSWFMEMLQRSPIGLSARRRPLSFPAAGEAHSFPVLPHAMGNDAEVVHQGKGRHSRLWSDVCLCHQLHHRCGTQKPAFRMESRSALWRRRRRGSPLAQEMPWRWPCATGSSREQRGLGACRCINTGCALCPAIVRGVRRVWKTLARICNP